MTDDESEFMESMATSDEEEEPKNAKPDEIKQFKNLHISIKKAIFDGIEDDMRDQQEWRYPPRLIGEDSHYASKTIMGVDFMCIDDINHERLVLRQQGESEDLVVPSEEEIQAAKDFLKGKGLSHGLIMYWIHDEDLSRCRVRYL